MIIYIQISCRYKNAPPTPSGSPTLNYHLDFETANSSFNLAVDFTLPPGYFKLCTLDQQVDYSFIDNACHEIKNICLQHILSDEDKEHFIHKVDSYCLHRKNIIYGKNEDLL